MRQIYGTVFLLLGIIGPAGIVPLDDADTDASEREVVLTPFPPETAALRLLNSNSNSRPAAAVSCSSDFRRKVFLSGYSRDGVLRRNHSLQPLLCTFLI